ncbi:MAG: hypothetical protein ACLR8Y_12335 [Alistipes indistinctus]
MGLGFPDDGDGRRAQRAIQSCALDMLLHSSKQFQFDEHGLATGGPWPYFPSNGGLPTAVADDGRGLGRIARRGSGFPERRDLGSQI